MLEKEMISEAPKRENGDPSARSIAGPDVALSQLDFDKLRGLCYSLKQQRVEQTKRQLEEGVISRIEAEGCCRCKMMTNFSEEKCVTQYCEHRRCRDCRDFNRGKAVEIG